MWVSPVGRIEEVLATPWVRPRVGARLYFMAARMDSELVRVSAPSRSDSLGSVPVSFILCSRFWVPQVPAASTTDGAVKVWRFLRSTAPVRTVLTFHTPPGGG